MIHPDSQIAFPIQNPSTIILAYGVHMDTAIIETHIFKYNRHGFFKEFFFFINREDNLLQLDKIM